MSKKINITEDIWYYSVWWSVIHEPKYKKVLTYEWIKNIYKKMSEWDLVEIIDWRDFTNKCESVKYYSEVNIIKKKRLDKKSKLNILKLL